MMSSGIKISELIAELQAMKALHGDVQVFAGGEDYPGGVSGVSYVQKGNGYVRSNSVTINTG